jgi:hypothetical protein
VTDHARLVSLCLEYLNRFPQTFAWPTHDVKHRPCVRGVTDISCCHRGKHYAIECKAGRDKMDEDQDEFGRRVVQALGVHVVVDSLDQLMHCIPEGKK